MRRSNLREGDTWEWSRSGCDDAARIADLERALQTCNNAFHSIVDRSGDGVLVINLEGKICYSNPAARKLLATPRDALLGDAFGIPVAATERTEITILRDGLPHRIAEMRVTKTEWQGEPAYLAMLRDVTERRQSEDRSKEDVRRRDVFLAMLSHELRNPLAAVSNAARLMARPNITLEMFHEAREVIERQCGQMTRLLEELLDVSRISQGKIELRRTCVALRGLLDDAVKATAGMFSEREQTLKVDFPEEELSIEADTVRLHQVLVNLLSNASKYSESGQSVLLHVENMGQSVRIAVRDEGVGMSADQLEDIFEPFAQIDSSLSRSDGGLGIGLSLVRSLVELHGGMVEAHSEGPGTGSEFILHLPLSAELPDEPVLDRLTETPKTLRILLVEDNKDVRRMLRSLLQMEGYEVEAAEDGTSGLELLSSFSPDLMFIDIGLPGIDGYEVAQTIRLDPANEHIHLVALTGYGQPSDREKAEQSGFDTHLSKPIDFTLLAEFLGERVRHLRNAEPVVLDRPTAVVNRTEPTDSA
ncbi:hybrid sensor histidine kinase/response regulator [Thalassoroseus pseudoceratinae]|uniref:hybrid sensor histidine kinase/response regulator n=1 Tax=Thalassoroseus pseudoceratinae TaxID=2713176 RepID=UPI001424731A|nr:ATP-binding protein [Thalassoroseus pseudoceratinae]